uniref:uncharacterized protein LOC122597411 n=1 Tax=Erigeron canadensis TaxID=72917 RepID=UPI001CB99740|nr:uncharacterized protein LOC122597411 [Erigeron canadensis]
MTVAWKIDDMGLVPRIDGPRVFTALRMKEKRFLEAASMYSFISSYKKLKLDLLQINIYNIMAMKSMITLLITLLVVVFVAQEAKATVGVVSVTGTVVCPVINGSTNINTTTNVTIPTPPRLPVVNGSVQATILDVPVGAMVRTDGLGRFAVTFVRPVLRSVENLRQVTTINVTPPPTACNSTLPPNTVLRSIPPLQVVSQFILSVQLNTTAGFQLPAV